MSSAARIVLVLEVEVAHCRLKVCKKCHLSKAHERGQQACGKRGKNGGEGGAKGVGYNWRPGDLATAGDLATWRPLASTVAMRW